MNENQNLNERRRGLSGYLPRLVRRWGPVASATNKKMTDDKLKEVRELAYGMSVGNLNPEDVVDYMAIASACARMESRRTRSCITSGPKGINIPALEHEHASDPN